MITGINTTNHLTLERLIGRSSHHLDMERLIGRSAYLILEGQICLPFGYVSNGREISFFFFKVLLSQTFWIFFLLRKTNINYLFKLLRSSVEVQPWAMQHLPLLHPPPSWLLNGQWPDTMLSAVQDCGWISSQELEVGLHSRPELLQALIIKIQWNTKN